jgi:uncharacterized metal-binding protein YceD (DUF177 family)
MELELRVELPKLALGLHRFCYPLTMALFEEKGDPLIEDLEGQAQVELDKATKLITLNYIITGKMTLPCDRCLKQYSHSFSFQHKVYYTFEPKMKEIEEDDVYFLDRNAQYLDLSQDIYDLVILQVPYRKVPHWCPSSECPEEIINLLQNKNINASVRVDDRWAALAKLNIQDESEGESAS